MEPERDSNIYGESDRLPSTPALTTLNGMDQNGNAMELTEFWLLKHARRKLLNKIEKEKFPLVVRFNMVIGN
jgi:hypothetical protein